MDLLNCLYLFLLFTHICTYIYIFHVHIIFQYIRHITSYATALKKTKHKNYIEIFIMIHLKINKCEFQMLCRITPPGSIP